MPIPVIMFHSVRPSIDPEWPIPYRFNTHTLVTFENYLRIMSQAGRHTVAFEEVYLYKKGDIVLPERTVCLTFDDGYLDNWVFVFPLLMKYQIKATIFVSTDFIDPRDTIRPTLHDYWNGRIAIGDLPTRGFLSAVEMRLMEESGLVHIESHAASHSFYGISEEIRDFRHPGDPHLWYSWNQNPQGKPFYMDMLGGEFYSSEWGSPVYEHAPAITARRLDEDGSLTSALREFVRDGGGVAFFAERNWREVLRQQARQLHRIGVGRFEQESAEDYQKRLELEITGSKSILESLLGHPAQFLCWPNGAYNEGALRVAETAGYLATTAKGSDNVVNAPTVNRIQRISIPEVKGGPILNTAYFLCKLGASEKRFPFRQMQHFKNCTRIREWLFYSPGNKA